MKKEPVSCQNFKNRQYYRHFCMFVCCYRQKHRIAWTILQTDGNFPDMHPENAARAIAPEQQPRMHPDGQQPEGHKNVIMPLRTKKQRHGARRYNFYY